MTRAVTIFVIVVVANALVLGYMYGFDSTAIAILCALVVVGGLAIAAARGRDKGITAPATCAACEGLISPNAPYCKHCGATVPRI